MDCSLFEAREREGTDFLSPSQLPFLTPPPPPQLESGFNFDIKISPTVLLTIILLAIIFFFSGLLHLLYRFLTKPQLRRDSGEPDGDVSAFQGQLQQLFHLHDSGVDQSFIDTLPVFLYSTIIGLKDPFDCAVCLCEFEPEDKLRLLTKCSHGFHMDCIDTWLLTHSTCPLCRASLLSDFSSNGEFSSAIVAVLESASNSSRRNAENDVVFCEESEFGFSGVHTAGKGDEAPATGSEEKVVPIKLGKFRTLGNNGESSSSSYKIDSRRCFSMGSFGYIMEENSSLRVPIRTPMKIPARKRPNMPLAPGFRKAMSEYDGESRREFKFAGDEESGEKRALSFHFPANWNGPRSENGTEMPEHWGREMDEENQRRNSLDLGENRPSFVRRTLLWFTGRNSRVVHSSLAPNL